MIAPHSSNSGGEADPIPSLDWEKIPQMLPNATDSFHIWVISDIQPTSGTRAAEVLQAAVSDILSLGLSLSGVWCLGDALRGSDREVLDSSTAVYLSELKRCAVPVCYLLGNHDMDYRGQKNACYFPLWEAARNEGDWHVQDHLEDFYFLRRFGKYLVVFLGDHADSDGGWWTTHGAIRESERYPYSPESFATFSQRLGTYDGPVIVAAHYAFPGGQKPSALQAQMLPLPKNVRFALHGHAHIGDLVWNKDDPWERVHDVAGQALTQYNISALEPDRSPGSHSALLSFEASGSIRLRIRCHQTRTWVDEFHSGPALANANSTSQYPGILHPLCGTFHRLFGVNLGTYSRPSDIFLISGHMSY